MKRLLNKLWHSSTQRVMSLGGMGMALALLADVMIVRRFGGFTATTDAIVIALTLPRLIGTIGRDATKFSLMTVFIEVRKDKGDAVFADFGARVLNLFFGIGLALTTIGLLFAGPLTTIIGWGLNTEDQVLAAGLLRLSAGIAVFALSSAVFEVMLNSHKHFTVTALRNAVTPCVVIAVTLATWRNEHAPYWIAGSFTCGYMLYCVMLWINAAVRMNFSPDPGRLPNRETFRKLRGTIGYPLTGFGVRQMARVAERTIASLGPTGSVAAYYYAYRLLSAVQNIVGVSVALTGQPKLTEHDLAGQSARFHAALRRRVAMILCISVPIAAGMMLLSPWIIGLLYGRADMAPEQLDASASVLSVLGLAAIFYCLTPVLNSALYARKRYGMVLYNMCLAASINVVLAFVLFKLLGLTGVAWAATLSALFAVCNLSWMISRMSRPQTP